MAKTTFNLNSVLATSDSVGEWDGREEEAAAAINMIYELLYEAAPEDICESKLAAIMDNVWNDWGDDESLLNLTEEDAMRYVRRFF